MAHRKRDVASGLIIGTVSPFVALGIARLFKRGDVPLWVAGISGASGYWVGSTLSHTVL